MLDLRPIRYDLPTMVTGDTLPAINFLMEGTEADLTRARVTVKPAGEATESLVLDSDTSGMTITDATSGGWDFDLDQIVNLTLAAGEYAYDLETTDSDGVVRTWLQGQWQILKGFTA